METGGNLAPSLLANQYLSAAAVSLLLYDHALTFNEETEMIWCNTGAGTMNRAVFFFNRYLSEGLLVYVAYMLGGQSRGLNDTDCRVFMWLFGASATVFIAVSHFIIITRLYILWDRRRPIKWILMAAFGVAISISFSFVMVAAHQVQPFVLYNDFLHICIFHEKPTLDLGLMLGGLTLFDLFIILMTVVNAYHRPYQKQAEVMTALQRDGALMFAGLFLLRVMSLMMVIFGDPTNCFVILSFVWAMCSMVNSRIQFRVEGLKFIRYTIPLGEGFGL